MDLPGCSSSWRRHRVGFSLITGKFGPVFPLKWGSAEKTFLLSSRLASYAWQRGAPLTRVTLSRDWSTRRQHVTSAHCTASQVDAALSCVTVQMSNIIKVWRNGTVGGRLLIAAGRGAHGCTPACPCGWLVAIPWVCHIRPCVCVCVCSLHDGLYKFVVKV